jgi:polysaccharide deacetylase family protein (PEP-CTERM system associated)
MSGRTPFLFSVDVEDAGDRTPLADLIERYLDFLRIRKAKATFFIVGEVARRHRDLIGSIAREGHEIGCHSDAHVPLDRQDRGTFRDDLRRNLEALATAGVERPRGYRAPCFSLTERTRWAYPILAEQGFTYSSSVLPARNPLYGWPGFGEAPRMMEGVLEMPISLLSAMLPVPAGGVYFRTMPMPLLRRALARRQRRGEPVLTYFHPYDIDGARSDRPHPGHSRWSPYNWLLQANRGRTMARLEAIGRLGFDYRTYGEQADELRREIDFHA